MILPERIGGNGSTPNDLHNLSRSSGVVLNSEQKKETLHAKGIRS